jgi:hypothetical protein
VVEFQSRIELPGGAWAELRDPYTVTERERRPLKRAFLALSRVGTADEKPGDVVVETPLAPMQGGSASPADDLGDFDAKLDAMEDFESAAAAFFITAWSFDSEPSADALLDIPAAAYAALEKACGERLEVLFPNLAQQGNTETP